MVSIYPLGLLIIIYDTLGFVTDFTHHIGTRFWTGMEKFNATHFSYGSNNDMKYFLPDKYFNSTRINFRPVVIHHVPLLNLEVCPERLEKYRKEQNLRNDEQEDGS